MLRPQFASNRQQNFDQIKKCVQDLLNTIPVQEEGSIIDLQPLCFNLTFNTTLFLIFGNVVEASGWGDDIFSQESKFAQAFNVGQDYLALRGRVGPFYWLLNTWKFRDACNTCHDFVNQAVTKAIEASSKKTLEEKEEDRYIFVEALLQESTDLKAIRDQCLNLLLAGRDTTGCCLQWSL